MKEKKLVRPRWTREEIKLLKKWYRNNPNSEIAGMLRRKVSSVVFKAHRLGLHKGPKRLREMGKENIAIRWGK